MKRLFLAPLGLLVLFAVVEPAMLERAPGDPEVAIELTPLVVDEAKPAREKTAVVMVNGFRFLANGREVDAPTLDTWQDASSPLVRLVGQRADVYALGYGQNQSLDAVVRSLAGDPAFRRLRQRGYSKLIGVGYSAGGLALVRLAETHPEVRLTRIVLVCCPHAGCHGADRLAVDPRHRAFVKSLTPHACKTCAKDRAGRPLAGGAEVVCVVGDVFRKGDLLLSWRHQWSAELQDHGVPLVRLPGNHFTIMESKTLAPRLADAILQGRPRWSPAQVAEARCVFE